MKLKQILLTLLSVILLAGFGWRGLQRGPERPMPHTAIYEHWSQTPTSQGKLELVAVETVKYYASGNHTRDYVAYANGVEQPKRAQHQYYDVERGALFSFGDEQQLHFWRYPLQEFHRSGAKTRLSWFPFPIEVSEHKGPNGQSQTVVYSPHLGHGVYGREQSDHLSELRMRSLALGEPDRGYRVPALPVSFERMEKVSGGDERLRDDIFRGRSHPANLGNR